MLARHDRNRFPEGALGPFRNRLQALYAQMDRAYQAAARRYGFDCQGCAESCCRTRFDHHTLLEYFYLREGLARLAPEVRAAVRGRAVEVRRETAALERQGRPVRLMCPLNQDGRCGLYAFRPMICRLHGIPHELRLPGRPVSYGSGCDLFSQRHARQAYVPFDRSPLYARMASLEQEIRGALGFGARLKMTIAEMLTDETGSAGDAPRSLPDALP
jgi:Fe-S-cluster containining protein